MWSNTLRLIVLAVGLRYCEGFQTPSVGSPAQRVVNTRDGPLHMISFGGVGQKSSGSDSKDLPRDVKDAISRCRAATQEALKNRISRMDVEFPVGTRFGVEKAKKKGKALADGGPTKDLLDQSDRELARLFVEMFQPVGGENIAVVFNEPQLSELAKKKWKGDIGASSRILSMGRQKAAKSKKKVSRAKGFAAKLAAEVDDSSDESGPFVLPDNAEVALFVSPGPKELVAIEKISNEAGMGTLIVLLNARLSRVSNFGTDEAAKLFTEDFEPVFSLTAASQEAAPDCLLYRAYPGDWVMARKPKVGQPKTLLTQAPKPTFDECVEAYEAEEQGDFEKGVENALENVVGWFN